MRLIPVWTPLVCPMEISEIMRALEIMKYVVQHFDQEESGQFFSKSLPKKF